MCGIAGFVSANPLYDKGAIVSDMLRSMSHRGPDQCGMKVFGDAALGMGRLSIVDTTPDEIPYEDPRGRFAAVYNGEIYNHDAIRARLRPRYEFTSPSDAQTALFAFMENGHKALAEFNGMYVLAVLDRRTGTLTVARDKAGEKPLYYAKGKDFFAFASEMKALLGLVPPEFNERALSYQAYEFTVGRETLFKGIFALEPGELITVRDGRPRLKSYWKVWEQRIDIPDDPVKVVDSLAELLEDAILLRTKNTAHGVGAFISGGVDSALTACVSKPDRLYTAHYEYADFDELGYAEMVAAKVGRELVVVRPTRDDFLRTRREIAYHLDSPCTWTSFTLWMLLERCSKDGLKVFLSGDGADELFGGYHRYHLLHHDQMIHHLEAMRQYAYLIERYYGSPVSRYARLVNRGPNPHDKRIQAYLERSIGFYFDKSQGDVVHGMGMNDFYTTMQVLLQMNDRLNMAFALENRSPFLDHRLIQFAFSMPSKYKIRNGVTKWALKEAARRFIPEPIVERTDKRGFSAPVNRWFQWERNGQYDRRGYRDMVLDDWREVFGVAMGKRPHAPPTFRTAHDA